MPASETGRVEEAGLTGGAEAARKLALEFQGLHPTAVQYVMQLERGNEALKRQRDNAAAVAGIMIRPRSRGPNWCPGARWRGE